MQSQYYVKCLKSLKMKITTEAILKKLKYRHVRLFERFLLNSLFSSEYKLNPKKESLNLLSAYKQ